MIDTVEDAKTLRETIFTKGKNLNLLDIKQIKSLEEEINSFCRFVSKNQRLVYTTAEESFSDLFIIKELSFNIIDRERELIGINRENVVYESNMIVSYFEMLEFTTAEQRKYLLSKIEGFSAKMIENCDVLTDQENLDLSSYFLSMITVLALTMNPKALDSLDSNNFYSEVIKSSNPTLH